MSFRHLLGALIGAAGVLAASAAQADVIIDSSTPGYYNDQLGDLQPLAGFPQPGTDPTVTAAPEPDLSTVTNLGTWLGSAAPSGGTWSGAPQAIPSSWTVNTETAIVYVIDAGAGGLANVQVGIGVDNGIYVWLNGEYQFGAMAPGADSENEYPFNLGSLPAGTHYLQVLREDHGGRTGYSIRVSAERVAAVPVPGALALLGIGLAGLGWGLRRRS
ncbi:MAG TPA: PEP-CTERM sorting domain-containing protein [Zeimonas sp.]